jgi:hypothetical protein
MEDFFETGIYFVIVGVALLLCLMVVLLVTATSKPKRQRRPVKGQQAGRQRLSGSDLKLLPDGGPAGDGRDNKRKNGKKPKKEKQDKHDKQKKRDQEKEDREQAAGKPDHKTAAAAATGENVEVASESVTVAELPSAETLDDSDEGNQEDTGNKEDLMSIFQIEETEDSYVSDLANKLFDVETSNIQALGLEVLSVLSGNRPPEETKEE